MDLKTLIPTDLVLQKMLGGKVEERKTKGRKKSKGEHDRIHNKEKKEKRARKLAAKRRKVNRRK